MPVNINVIMRIKGNDFDPHIITSKISITPSKIWREGESLGYTSSYRQYDCWLFETGFYDNDDIDFYLNKIFHTFNSKKKIIKDIKRKYNLDISIDIIVKMSSRDTPSLYFDKYFIEFVNYLDATIDCDLYISSDESEEYIHASQNIS